MENINYNIVYEKYLKHFFDYIVSLLFNVQKDVFIRNSKLSFKDVFYFMCSVNSHTALSYNFACNKATLSGLLNYNITDSAVTKRKNSIDVNIFKNITDKVLNKIYDNDNDTDEIYRLLACDGSFFYISKFFEKDGTKLSNNKTCCKCLISTIYDIDRKIPISQIINKNNSENEAIRQQLKELKKNDIVVMDRLYYSIDLFFTFISQGINAIFRLKSCTSIYNKIYNSKQTDIIIIVKHKNIDVTLRLIRYRIRNTEGCFINYYLATTLLDKIKFPQTFFEKAYFKRWRIETYFRTLKEYTPVKYLKSKTFDGIVKDIHITQFLFILSSYVKYILEKEILKDDIYNINCKNCFMITTDNLLKNIFYHKNKEEVLKILKVITESQIKIVDKRHYERTKKTPLGKFTNTGSKTSTDKMKKKKEDNLKKRNEKTEKYKHAFISKADCPNVS